MAMSFTYWRATYCQQLNHYYTQYHQRQCVFWWMTLAEGFHTASCAVDENSLLLAYTLTQGSIYESCNLICLRCFVILVTPTYLIIHYSKINAYFMDTAGRSNPDKIVYSCQNLGIGVEAWLRPLSSALVSFARGWHLHLTDVFSYARHALQTTVALTWSCL